jgi:hypothetical protein
MSRIIMLSAALLTATTLAAPAMARNGHVRHAAQDTYYAQGSYAPDTYRPTYGEPYAYGQACAPAPRVGAFATAPWTGADVPCQPWAGGY